MKFQLELNLNCMTDCSCVGTSYKGPELRLGHGFDTTHVTLSLSDPQSAESISLHRQEDRKKKLMNFSGVITKILNLYLFLFFFRDRASQTLLVMKVHILAEY